MERYFNHPLSFYLIPELFGFIKSSLIWIKEMIISHIRVQLHFSLHDCPLAFKAVIKELSNSNSLKVIDGPSSVEFEPIDGIYSLNDKEITCRLDGDRLTLSSSKTMQSLQDYVVRLDTSYNSPEVITRFFISSLGKWSPAFRSPRKIKTTPDMDRVLEEIANFKSEKSECHPYRRGYLLYGPTGTGKTAVIEIVAQIHLMPVYLLYLNDEKMSDSVLVKLISGVGPNSIIVIDEVDKQMNQKVTIGGLLSAIDGPQRLPEGSIFILTANTDKFLEEEQMQLLLRKGRIDMKFLLQIPL